jgi:hypothetical protein
MIKVKKLYILLGIGGSRKDFVTGWLGTLPNFINTRWYLNLATGGSFSDAYYIKELDALPDMTFKQMLLEKDISIDSDAKLNLAVSCHGLHLANSLSDLNSDQYEIINIDVDDDTLPTIFWEQFVKNFLRHNNTIEELENNNFSNRNILRYVSSIEDIDALTNDEQIKVIEGLYPNYDMTMPESVQDIKNRLLWCRNQDTIDIHHINYKDLFISGGSTTLCDSIGISAPTINHAFWDAMLPFAKSPGKLEFLGKTWNRTDHIK